PTRSTGASTWSSPAAAASWAQKAATPTWPSRCRRNRPASVRFFDASTDPRQLAFDPVRLLVPVVRVIEPEKVAVAFLQVEIVGDAQFSQAHRAEMLRT